jgi:two-component system, NarL family, response regulator NreC
LYAACILLGRLRHFKNSGKQGDFVSSWTGAREVTFPAKKIRCALLHDHVLFRQGLRRLLEEESDLEVVSEAGNAAECLRKVHDIRPDVLIVDAATFGLTAAEVKICVERESPQIRIVFLETQPAESRLKNAQTIKESCAVRETSAEELAGMIRKSYSRDQSGRMKPSSTGSSAGYSPRPVPTVFPQERALTNREREVLKLLAEGKTVRAAATVLGLSSKTVDAHKFNLMRKLGIHNKAELVMWAIRKKVVQIPVNF